MNQYKQHIKRLRDDYNAAVWASSPFYDEPEDYRSWDLDYEAHASACAHIIADAYRKGDYAHMWEALNEALKPRDDDCDELTCAILTETISRLQWDTQPINQSVFDNAAFTGMVLDSLASLTAEYAAMTLELVIEALGEGDDTERANSLTIMEHAASIILARTPPISERDTKRVTRSLPFLRHQSIADHITRAPGEQETTFTRLGDKILRCEAIACEEIGDDEMEAAARRAHAYLCLTLMDRRSLPHRELAALIDTMQTSTSSGGIPTIVISPNVWRNTITTAEELIDYAADRMSAAL